MSLNIAYAKSTITIDNQNYYLDCPNNQGTLIVQSHHGKTITKSHCNTNQNINPPKLNIDIKTPEIPQIPQQVPQIINNLDVKFESNT